MDTQTLTQEQIGGLTEIANVGIGRATANLSQLMRRRCLIDIPKVAPLDDGVRAFLSSSDAYMVHLQIKIERQTPASIFIVMSKTDAHNILSAIPKDVFRNTNNGANILTAQFVLRHVGEIMAEAFFDGLSQMLLDKGRYALPPITVSGTTVPLEVVMRSLQKEEEESLAVHSAFFDRDRTFRGKFVYIIGLDFLRIIFKWINSVIYKSKGTPNE